MRAISGLALGLLLAVVTPALADPSPAASSRAAAAADPETVAPADSDRQAPAPSEPLSPASTVPEDVPLPDAPAPSVGVAVWRVIGAIVVVGVLLTLTLAVLRALFRQPGRTAAPAGVSRLASRLGWRALWGRRPGEADGLEIVERGYVGTKESVCIVRVGGDRFLIGVTPAQISLLARLGQAAGTDPAAPAAADFGRLLTGHAVPRPEPADAAFRAVLERSRERLARLEAEPVHAGGPHA